MTFRPTHADRLWLVSKLAFSGPATQEDDLLDPTFTHDSIIEALMRATKQGHRLLITCVNRDHDCDLALGTHGHTSGFSVDCAMIDDRDAERFLQDACTDNPRVTRLGLGGMYQHFSPTPGDTIVFMDNHTDHIHLQTGG